MEECVDTILLQGMTMALPFAFEQIGKQPVIWRKKLGFCCPIYSSYENNWGLSPLTHRSVFFQHTRLVPQVAHYYSNSPFLGNKGNTPYIPHSLVWKRYRSTTYSPHTRSTGTHFLLHDWEGYANLLKPKASEGTVNPTTLIMAWVWVTTPTEGD